MTRSASWLVLTALAIVLLAACDRDRPPPADHTRSGGEEAGKIGGSMILATTTSTRDSGLLDVLVPQFERQSGVEVKVIAVGTGAALAMAARGDADAVLVHAPEAERRFVQEGHLVSGRQVMHNDFVLVGPARDPAQVRQATDLTDAMKRLATAPFVSRGDDSGTHKRELVLWRMAGIDPTAVERRIETGQGMGETLHVADERNGYTLTDRGTYLAQRQRLGLEVVYEGAEEMLNVYHVHLVNPAKHAGVKRPQAEAFATFLVSKDVQEQIGRYRAATDGPPLFVPDALGSGAAPSGSAGPRPTAP
jgi:tungstate transport system substrate-binding protein